MCILMFIALVVDLLTLIPLVGDIMGPLYWIALAVFLWFKGFGFLNFKRAAPMIISVVGELIPAIQALPTILAGTIALIFVLKVQEKTGLSLNTLTSGKVNLAKNGAGFDRLGNSTLNYNGVRQPSAPQTPEEVRNTNNRPLVVDGVRAPQK